MIAYYKNVKTPVGTLKLVASEKGLLAILWQDERPNRVKLPELKEDLNHAILVSLEEQLKKYFAGSLKHFSIPLDMQGTPFQQEVWKALLTIPYGETKSYSELAAQIKRPKASRAVGAANGRNPLSIVVPCHRVVGANGTLTGFAGGLEVKERLLKLEGNL